MKITAVKIRWVEGLLAPETPFYDATRASRVRYLPTRAHYSVQLASDSVGAVTSATASGQRKLTEGFVYIETDEGITGLAGPIIYGASTASIILQDYAPVLLGEDPMNNERLWDIMHRKHPVATGGKSVIALSLCDIAIWDIRCKKAGLPLHQMLGGKTQKSLQVYANCTGCAFNDDTTGYDLEQVAQQTQWCIDNGFIGAKWYPHRGPADGRRGLEDIYQLYRTIRDTAGSDFQIMIDVWSGWDPEYTLKAAKMLEPLDIAWIEEPVLPGKMDQYAYISRNSPIPISAGENHFMRWQFKLLLDETDVQIFQPDPAWCGGITETVKILTLIEAYGRTAALHNSNVPVGVQLAATCPRGLNPVNEYLVTITPARQHFFLHPVMPEHGSFYVPEHPGVGVDIDECKVMASWYQE